MDPLIAILVFASNVADDALAVLFVRRCAAGKALQASLISGALTLLVAFSVVNYVENKWYLVPILLGSMVGCWVAVTWDRAYRKKSNAKKRKKVADEDRKKQVEDEQRGGSVVRKRTEAKQLRASGPGIQTRLEAGSEPGPIPGPNGL